MSTDVDGRGRGAERRWLSGAARDRLGRLATLAAALAGLTLGTVSCGAGPRHVEGGSQDRTGPVESGSKARSGPVAPDFSLPALDGSIVRLSDYLGRKVILIDFWSTTCDPCLQAMPDLVALYDKQRDRGFVVLAVSVDGPESIAQVRAVVHDRKMRFPVLLDEETDVMARYNPKRELPFTVVIDRGGSIVHKRAGHQGASGMKALIQAVEDALGEG